MKILLLKDKTINNTMLGQVQLQVENIYKNNTGVTIEWAIEEQDYTNYNIEEYLPWKGYWGINRGDIARDTSALYKRWGEEIDMVVYLIDSSNWKLTGVWGWAISKHYSGYGVLQVRFANEPTHTMSRNVNNTVGTLYHEMMHDHDTFVFTYTGELVEHIVPVENWDAFVVHGGRDLGREGENGWKYIRHNENQHALSAIAPALKKAIANRRALFEEKVGAMQTIIQLANQYLVLLRAKLAEQRGDIAILPDNKCSHVTQN